VYLVLVTFFVLLWVGLRAGDITLKLVAICCVLAAAGFPIIYCSGMSLIAYTAWLAAIDVFLVLKVFKGDIQIR